MALLQSLQVECNTEQQNFEVLIKFDEDDSGAYDFAGRVLSKPKANDIYYPIKFCFGPRGRGYIDIHHGYAQAYKLHDPRCTVVGAMADDFLVFQKHWDNITLELADIYSDGIFVIHGRPHPPLNRPKFINNKYFLDWKIEEMGDLYIVDEAPMWGRGLIDRIGFGPISFTDVWTLVLQYYLWHDHKVNRSLFLPGQTTYRKVNPKIDQQGAPRWNTDRKWNFDYIASQAFKDEIKREAEVLARDIKK